MIEYKAIIFDLDGTLLDTEGIHYKSWDHALTKHAKSISEEKYLDYAGRHEQIVANAIVSDFALDSTTKELIDWRHEYLDKHMYSDIKYMPSAIEILEFFNRNEFLVAAATGGVMEETQKKIEKANLETYFKIIVCADHVKRGKPFPDIYHYFAQKLGVSPQECLVFEDSSPGAMAAFQAGCCVAAIPNKWTSMQDFSMAKYRFNDLGQAIEFFSK
jgi:DNA helicase-2/ATP-dependent DNA helicase PcrA